jgi:hypothetical protein
MAIPELISAYSRLGKIVRLPPSRSFSISSMAVSVSVHSA